MRARIGPMKLLVIITVWSVVVLLFSVVDRLFNGEENTPAQGSGLGRLLNFVSFKYLILGSSSSIKEEEMQNYIPVRTSEA